MVKSALKGGAGSASSTETPIQAGEFKAKCLELMDLVAETGGSFLITKRGRPVARLVPAEAPPTSLLDCAAGLLEIAGDIVDPPSPRTEPRRDRAGLLAEALGNVAVPSPQPPASRTLSVSEARSLFASPARKSKTLTTATEAPMRAKPRAAAATSPTRSKRKK